MTKVAPSPSAAGAKARVAAALAVLCVAACAPIAVAPPGTAPQLPADWKNAAGGGEPAGESLWRPAQPGDDAPVGAWWVAFSDPVLGGLEERLLRDNPGLRIAVSRLDQARALASVHEAALLPAVQAGLTASRTKVSADRPLGSYAVRNSSTVQNDFRPVLSASYEIDWLGRVRRDVEAARADAEQAAADARGVRLLASAQLATAYFQLRGLDEEIDLAGRTGDAQKQVLDLSRERYEAGAASQAELSQQRALVEGTLAQLALLGLQRARAEDAIAVLVGAPASSFHVARAPLATAPPAIALLAPSRLLERRPDIASAERAMAAANARIGVARAARFPSLLLAPAFAGTESNAISTLFSAPALVWSLGAGLSQAVFDGGRNRAGVDVARAGYAAAAEQYRQSVLAGISEAEDALAAVRANAQAREMQDAAVHDTERAYEAGAARHREGLDSALTLALVQQNLLAARRAQAQVRTAQFLAAVDLVKALGGSWER